jgi:pimeloyl-ACP methyl ester carboxylesterase
LNAPAASTPTLRLRAIHSFFVGGRTVALQGLPVEQHRFAQNGAARAVDPNGHYRSGQMYVQAFLQAQPSGRPPVLLWHGGGMTGVNWETTPDGRPGWRDAFLRAGYDVYVSDAVERGRAGWSRWPDIYEAPPLHRTLEEGWDMFRIGPAGGWHEHATQRRAHPGGQFPAAAFDDFATQWVPRWAGHEALTLAAYDALLQRIGRCIVIGHSQGGGFALEAVRRRPHDVAAVVAIEPSGAPAQAGATLPPHLYVWGDHVQAHPVWRGYRETVERHAQGVRAAGGRADVLDLPREGVHGNSHFPMLDLNAADVAGRVLSWLDGVLEPPDPAT